VYKVLTLRKLIPALLGLLIVCVSLAQEPAKAPVDGTQPSMYSGIVISMGGGKLTVSRHGLSTPEKRTFSMNSATKVEGKLRTKARVTVRYRTEEDGYLAIAILVRESKKR
jgi:hypothetical protein